MIGNYLYLPWTENSYIKVFLLKKVKTMFLGKTTRKIHHYVQPLVQRISRTQIEEVKTPLHYESKKVGENQAGVYCIYI